MAPIEALVLLKNNLGSLRGCYYSGMLEPIPLKKHTEPLVCVIVFTAGRYGDPDDFLVLRQSHVDVFLPETSCIWPFGHRSILH